MTIENIVSGFRATRIGLYDKDVITIQAFALSFAN